VCIHPFSRCLFAVGVPFARLTLTHPFSSLLANLENSASDQLMSEEPREPSASKAFHDANLPPRRRRLCSSSSRSGQRTNVTSSPLNEHATVAAADRAGTFPTHPAGSRWISSPQISPSFLPKAMPKSKPASNHPQSIRQPLSDAQKNDLRRLCI